MRALEFVQIDVFTDRPFAGNQLAVFLDGRGLSTEQMQTIAREMNFSETTFVLPPSSADSDVRLRIFTTTKEMPMAGHPVVGTALVLYQHNIIRAGINRFDLAIGPVAITVEAEDPAGPVIWMNQGAASFGPQRADRHRIAEALGLAPDDLVQDLPIQVVSTGVPYLIVPVRDVSALGRAQCDQAALRALRHDDRHLCFYLFAHAPQGLRARMFDPTPNEIPEDPATGSAAGPLAAYANAYGLSASPDITIAQGVEIGRPSLILARVESSPEVENVLIGGTGKIVGEGRIFLD